MLPILVLVACAHRPPTTEDAGPFAGCEASEKAPLRMLSCKSAGTLIAAMSANGEPGEVLNGGMSMIGVTAATVDEVPRKSGPPMKVFRSADSPMGPVVASAVSRRKGVAELLICAPSGAACDARLLSLVDQGWPDLKPMTEGWVDPVPFEGHPLTVPHGCFPLKDAPVIGFSCGVDTVAGGVVSDGGRPEESLAGVLKARADAVAANGRELPTHPVECTVAGAPGACAYFLHQTTSAFEPPHDVLGYATLPDGRQVFATCRWGGEPSEPPAFCGQLLTWTRP